jgi:hypothetical protein
VRRLVELGLTDASGAYHATVPVHLEAAGHRDSARVVVFTQKTGSPIGAAGAISGSQPPIE